MDDDIAWLGGWEGYRVCGVEWVEGEQDEIWISLAEPSGDFGPVCEGCGELVTAVHEIVMRRIRDLLILDARTWLEVPRRRLHCPRCGQKLPPCLLQARRIKEQVKVVACPRYWFK